jgi:hypothetical protein
MQLTTRLTVLTLTAGLLWPASAFSTEGNDLYHRCTATDGKLSFWCTGYVAGVADTLPRGPSGRGCPSDNVTVGDVREAVIKFLEHHPELRDMSATGLIGLALPQAFPCK